MFPKYFENMYSETWCNFSFRLNVFIYLTLILFERSCLIGGNFYLTYSKYCYGWNCERIFGAINLNLLAWELPMCLTSWEICDNWCFLDLSLYFLGIFSKFKTLTSFFLLYFFLCSGNFIFSIYYLTGYSVIWIIDSLFPFSPQW